ARGSRETAPRVAPLVRQPVRRRARPGRHSRDRVRSIVALAVAPASRAAARRRAGPPRAVERRGEPAGGLGGRQLRVLRDIAGDLEPRRFEGRVDVRGRTNAGIDIERSGWYHDAEARRYPRP